MELLFATTNAGKMREIRAILQDMPVTVHSLKDLGIEADVEETGSTFEENALIGLKKDFPILNR